MPRVLRNVGASFVVPLGIVSIFIVSTFLAIAPVAAGQTPQPTPAPDLTAPFFSGDTLHEVRIVINDRDWALLQENWTDKTYYPCQVTVDGTTIRDVGIRPRGNGSRSRDKPGMRVDFNRYREQLFLGVLTAVVLDNVVQDKATIRERVSMATFQRLGLPAPRETHAKVYKNDVYLGMYAFVEEINKNYLKRVYGGTVGAIENDGYLYEYEWIYPYFFEYLGEDLTPYSLLFKAKTHESAPMGQLYDRVHELVRAINEANEDNYEAIVGTYFDLDALMMHLALENFLADFDGILGDWGMNNFYLYQFENQHRWQFHVWDKDNTFAPPTEDHPRRAIEWDIFRYFDQNHLVRRGINVPAVRERYLNALLRIADSVSEQLPLEESPDDRRGWMEREIAKEYHQVKDGVYADNVKGGSNEEFEASVQYMLAFARERAAFVRQAVAQARAGTSGAATARVR